MSTLYGSGNTTIRSLSPLPVDQDPPARQVDVLDLNAPELALPHAREVEDLQQHRLFDRLAPLPQQRRTTAKPEPGGVWGATAAAPRDRTGSLE
ncbi:MAG: hypothetical protein ACT4PY_06565 [Armatimonadota bacterium]